MLEDVRDKLQLGHEDVLALNFIRDTGTYFYRRHYRAGLRSHIMEVLDPADVKKEKQGIMIGGLMRFPRARPLRMLRIFRTRFPSLKEALDESRRVKILERYLVPDHLARSDEFLVDYRLHGKHELLLCGLQAYVEGEILDPWRHLDERYLLLLSERMGIMSVGDPQIAGAEWVKRTVREAVSFIGKIREMIAKADHVPDLAGVGNLILTPSGKIKLVDINNISRVSFKATIPLDDRGYPVCDKSVEALSLIERKLLGRSIDAQDPLYRVFLDPERMKEVKSIEEEFLRSMEASMRFRDPSSQSYRSVS